MVQPFYMHRLVQCNLPTEAGHRPVRKIEFLVKRRYAMSVRPIDFNGMIQSNQDVSNIKSREDNQGAVVADNAVVTTEQKVEHQANSVTEQENVAEDGYDGGGNGASYSGSEGRKKKKKKFETDGEVRPKGMSGGFNITI